MFDDEHEEHTGRGKLTNTLERIVKTQKLEGVQTESFVDSRSLCTSCVWATITRRSGRNNRVIRCGEMGMFVPEDISECNNYKNLTTLSLSQMAEMATLIEISEKQVGFYKREDV